MRYFVLTIIVAIASTVVAGLLYLWLTIKVETQEKKLLVNHNQILLLGSLGDELKAVLKANSELAERKLAFERLATRSNFNVDLLAEFSFLIPRNVSLTELSYSEKERNIKIKGRSTNAEGVADFVSNLVSSMKFAQIQQRSMVQESTGPSSFAFALDCSLLGGQ